MSKTNAIAAAAGLAAAMMSLPAQAEDDLLARGAYLMNGIVSCGNCHTPQGPDGPVAGMELAGGFLIEEEALVAYAPNITPDMQTGIGGWSDEEIARAIREGIRPDGTIIGPPMPIVFYASMSDADTAAIIAYLRQVEPVANEVPPSVFHFPLPPAWGPPVANVSAPDPSDQVAYGGYLVAIGHCMECHTPPAPGGGPDMSRMGAGGFTFSGPWGVVVSRNITPHPEGLGDWTDAEIVRAITQGISRDGSQLNPPMGFGYYANITEDDLAAIVAYLRTIPPQASVTAQ